MMLRKNKLFISIATKSYFEQTLSSSPNTTLENKLNEYRQLVSYNFKEVSRLKCDRLMHYFSKETIYETLMILRSSAKQAFGDPVTGFVETFVFRAFLLKVQREFSTSG